MTPIHTVRSILVASTLLSGITHAAAEQRDGGTLGNRPSRGWPEVTVENLDGSSLVGQRCAINDRHVTIEGSTVGSTLERTIPLDDVLALRFTTVAKSRLQSAVLALSDGSRLPVAEVTLNGDQVGFELPEDLSAAKPGPFTVPTAKVRSIRIGGAGRHDAAWSALLESPPESDLIVVLRKQGAAIRSVPCVVEQIDAGSVSVRLDGEAVAVPRARVYGAILARAGEAVSEPPAVMVTGRFGRLAASGVASVGSQSSATDGRLAITSPLGFTLVVPFHRVAQIDFSASRLRWLVDLELVRHSWRPALGFPAALDPADRPPGIAFDRALGGGQLTLVDQETYPRGGSVQAFEHGVAMRSAGEAVFRVPPGYTRFQATAGIDPRTAKAGAVVLRLYADDRLAYERTINGSKSTHVAAELGDAETLRVEVGYGENLDFGDNLHLGSARVTK